MVSTDKTQFTVEWFLRRKRLCIKSNRGIPGIDEIKRLLNAERLTLKLSNPKNSPSIFPGISKQIIPLRAACHW